MSGSSGAWVNSEPAPRPCHPAAAQPCPDRIICTIVIGFSVAADAVTLRYEDTAPAFDFAAALAQTIDPLDVEFDLRPVGNLGLRLLSHYADSVSYARTSGRNQITLTLRRSP